MSDGRPDFALRRSNSSSAARLLSWMGDRVPEVVFLVVTTAAGLWAAARWVDPVGDPGFAWSLGYRLAHGERLYRDVYLAYGPLSPYLLALAVRLFGHSSLSVALFHWIPAVIAGLLLVRCGRRYLSPLAGVSLVGLLLAISFFVPGAGRLVFPYYPGAVHALAFSLGGLLLLEKTGARLETRAYLAGALAGVAFCCKQEIGLAALIALCAPLLTGREGFISWLPRLLMAFLCVLAVAALFAFSSAPIESLRWRNHLWPLNALPPPEFQRLFRSAAGMSSPDWPSPVRSAAWRLLFQIGLLVTAGILAARERKVSRWLPVLALFLALAVWWGAEGFSSGTPTSPVCLSMVVAFLVAGLALLRPHLEGRLFLAAFGIFAGLAGLRTAFSPFTTGHYEGPGHFAASLTWILFLCVFVPKILAPGDRAAAYSRSLIAAAVLVISCVEAAGGIQSLRSSGKEPLDTREGRIFLSRPQARFFEALKKNLLPGEKALVLPEVNAVDALFHLRNVSPLLDHLPGLLGPEVQRELIAQFEKSPPDVVVLFVRPTGEFGVGPFGRGYGHLLAEWCFRNYRVTESSSAGMILRRRRGGPLGDAEISVPVPRPGYNRAL